MSRGAAAGTEGVNPAASRGDGETAEAAVASAPLFGAGLGSSPDGGNGAPVDGLGAAGAGGSSAAKDAGNPVGAAAQAAPPTIGGAALSAGTVPESGRTADTGAERVPAVPDARRGAADPGSGLAVAPAPGARAGEGEGGGGGGGGEAGAGSEGSGSVAEEGRMCPTFASAWPNRRYAAIGFWRNPWVASHSLGGHGDSLMGWYRGLLLWLKKKGWRETYQVDESALLFMSYRLHHFVPWFTLNRRTRKPLHITAFPHRSVYMRWPGCHLDVKQSLYSCLVRKAQIQGGYGKSPIYDFFPRTFIFDPKRPAEGIEEFSQLFDELAADSDEYTSTKWLMKPGENTYGGEGIHIVNDKVSAVSYLQAQADAYRRAGFRASPTARVIAQKLIDNAFTLSGRRRFDIRVYLLILSLDPLRVYWAPQAMIVRLTGGQRPSDGDRSSTDRQKYLTNFSLHHDKSALWSAADLLRHLRLRDEVRNTPSRALRRRGLRRRLLSDPGPANASADVHPDAEAWTRSAAGRRLLAAAAQPGVDPLSVMARREQYRDPAEDTQGAGAGAGAGLPRAATDTESLEDLFFAKTVTSITRTLREIVTLPISFVHRERSFQVWTLARAPPALCAPRPAGLPQPPPPPSARSWGATSCWTRATCAPGSSSATAGPCGLGRSFRKSLGVCTTAWRSRSCVRWPTRVAKWTATCLSQCTR